MVLAILKDGSELHYRKLAFYLCCNKTKKKIVSLDSCIQNKLLSCFRLTTRLFRLEPRCIVQLDAKRFVLCILHKIWVLDIEKGVLDEIQKSREGFSDPLKLCTDGINVYWGDYGNNINRDYVNIYLMQPDKKIRVVYKFDKGSVRHIHNIIFDKNNNLFWILTGDNERLSGIYKADYNWEHVNPVVIGKQENRAVIAFPYNEGILYATDSVEFKNFIFHLKNGAIEKLASINGSCIHGIETKDYYVFSTTVEPTEGRGIRHLFTYKLGGGIISNESHILAVNKKTLEVKTVRTFKKDIWPMKLFQYGMVFFPIGQDRLYDLHYYVIACKGDGKSMNVKL